MTKINFALRGARKYNLFTVNYYYCNFLDLCLIIIIAIFFQTLILVKPNAFLLFVVYCPVIFA